MKKIFISEKDMPKCCNHCPCYDSENGYCKASDKYFVLGDCVPKDCPLQSLERHDNEVRREFAEKVKEKIENLNNCDGWDEEQQGYNECKNQASNIVRNLLKQYELEEYEEKLKVRK